MRGIYVVPPAQSGRLPRQQETQLPHHPRRDAAADSQLPIEHVAKGEVLGKHSTVNTDTASFYKTSQYLTTSTPACGGIPTMAQYAINEYQSFALLGKGRSMPLHKVDEYV